MAISYNDESRQLGTNPAIYVIHENADWTAPLYAAFEKQVLPIMIGIWLRLSLISRKMRLRAFFIIA